MPAHIRWGSIELLHNVIRTLNYLKERNGIPLPTVTYRAKVKLHGNNAAVQITDEGVFPQSRTQLLTPEDDLKGFAKWVLESPHYWKSLSPMVVFGEWCGPGVHRKVALRDIPHKVFAVFAIQLGHGEDARIVYEPDALWRHLNDLNGPIGWMPKGMFVLPWYDTPVTVHYGDEDAMKLATEVFNNMVESVEREDPWVKQTFNVSGRGEGVVLYPVGKDIKTDPESLELLMFKAKGIKHQTNKTRKPVQVDPEVVKGAEEFAALMVTDARLEQGVDEAVGGEYDIRKMGQFLRWVTEDVQKESVAELEASGLEWKQVVKAVQGASREWYKAKALG